jgi:ureidoglycolate amidohydrolase
MELNIETGRLSAELEQLATFSDMPAPAVTRVVFSEADRRARAFVKSLCGDAGLAVREDAVGNTFARWVGASRELPAIGTGSHIDAIPNAGMYDGTVGVLGGLEAIRTLRRAGFRPDRSIELLLFTSEEPTLFGIGCLGSRLIAGTLDAGCGERLRDREGRTLNEIRTAAGFTGALESVRLPEGYYAGFVELHIEQGPLLERENLPLGIVTAIAAPASLRLTIEGEGGHAGAVLMPGRRDAFLGAAEIALAAEQAAKGTGAIDTVATSGVCDVFPGAINSIPSRVRIEFDIRDTDVARRDAVVRRVEAARDEVARRRGLEIRTEVINSDPPAACDAALIEALAQACARHSLPYKKMVSRAYHDSLFVSRIAPAAMLFIPCRAGVSHRPDEFSSAEAISNGVLVLAEALASLA